MGLTEAEDIKKRWQEYIEEPHKKDLHDPDNYDGVITRTHLEPDMLGMWSQVGRRKCHYKTNKQTNKQKKTEKPSGGDGISVELFKILKDDAMKMLHSICQQIWKSQQ